MAHMSPKGPCTQHVGTWGFGNSNSSAGFGFVYESKVSNDGVLEPKYYGKNDIWDLQP